MPEVVWLCLLMSAVLFVGAVVVMLAVGAVFGVGWLLWKALVFAADLTDMFLEREGKKTCDEFTQPVFTGHAHLPRRVRPPGAQRPVRVQGGLVPASACVAQRDLVGVQPGRRGRSRGRHE